jgi:hypothetical protein
MRYLFTTDQDEFIELEDFTINPSNAPVVRVPTMTGGIPRKGRREADRVSYTSHVSLPAGQDAFILDSSGKMHVILVKGVETDLSLQRYDGVLLDIPDLPPEGVQKIRQLFTLYDAAGASKHKPYKR